MAEFQSQILRDMEYFLRLSVEANYWLTFADVNPVAVVEQIREQLAERRFEWLDGDTYVPNSLTVYVPDVQVEKLEEVEVLFNSVVFTKYLYEYITECGYRLFDFLKIEVKEADLEQREFGGPCYLFFDWPERDESLEHVTVSIDQESRKILERFEVKPEIPRLARLTALNAEVYRNQYMITREATHLGRLRKIRDKKTGQVLRRNDFVFARQEVPDSPNASVSRRHAKIVFEDNAFFLYDTGSTNGTQVEREKSIVPVPVSTDFRRRVQLYDGDIVVLGSARVLFELIRTPEEIAEFIRADEETTTEGFESRISEELLTTGRMMSDDTSG